MKIRHAMAGLLAAIAVAGVAPTAVAATPTAAKPSRAYSQAAPARFHADSAPGTIHTDAAPTPNAQTAAATCPAQGHRIKVSTDPMVYLVGPSNDLYYFSTSADYFSLYNSYSGITTVSSSVLDACLTNSDWKEYPLNGAKLVKVSGTPEVYIYDTSYVKSEYRWITSQSVFDRYGFASSKILRIALDDLNPVGSNWS